MPSALALFARMRIWSLLLLAAIGLQAATPIRAPLERLQGSAFSAATLDVALSSARRGHGVQVATALPVPVVPLAATEPAAIAAPRFAAPSHLRPDTRGPPPRGHPARVPDSTAPPIA
jgi:hypothetical protein